MSSKWVFDWELLFYSGVGRCTEGVGVYGVSFYTGGDNSFVAECFRDNNFDCKGFRGNCWGELGDTYLSIYWCVGISAVKLWVSISMGWGMVGVGSKSHRGQEEQEDLKWLNTWIILCVNSHVHEILKIKITLKISSRLTYILYFFSCRIVPT